MIAWLVGIITGVLLLFMFWRKFSSGFCERVERPKYKLLEQLGIEWREEIQNVKTHISEENTHEKPKS
jgi:hypothetical protein